MEKKNIKNQLTHDKHENKQTHNKHENKQTHDNLNFQSLSFYPSQRNYTLSSMFNVKKKKRKKGGYLQCQCFPTLMAKIKNKVNI